MRQQVEFDDGERWSTSSAERQLWCAVIERALQDALDSVGAVSHPPERFRLREDARRWFAGNDVDFRVACDSAGYDPDVLRDHVLQIIHVAKSAAAS